MIPGEHGGRLRGMASYRRGELGRGRSIPEYCLLIYAFPSSGHEFREAGASPTGFPSRSWGTRILWVEVCG